MVKDFGFDINDYPELKERLMKQSMRFYLSRYIHKKPGNEEHLPLDRIEDLFSGFKPMLSYLVEDLVFKGKMNEAKGVYERHDLHDTVREDIKEQLADVIYDPKKDTPPYDEFGPLSEG